MGLPVSSAFRQKIRVIQLLQKSEAAKMKLKKTIGKFQQYSIHVFHIYNNIFYLWCLEEEKVKFDCKFMDILFLINLILL